MRDAPRNDELLTGMKLDLLSANHKRVATLDNDHVFVELVHVRRGNCRFVTSPERHLAPVRSVEKVTFHSGSRLAPTCNSILLPLHELRKILHRHGTCAPECIPKRGN